MNKSDLIKAVATDTGLTQADANKAIDATLAVIGSAVKRGEQVAITGFGTFVRKDRPARMGRNPRTGEDVKIKARKSAAWKPSSALKDL
jgi:DNA-binding protein HU-beta